jgi:hypothetical protein
LMTLDKLGQQHQATTVTAILQQWQQHLCNNSKDTSATTLTAPSQRQQKQWQRDKCNKPTQ